MRRLWAAAAFVAFSSWLGGCSLVVDFDEPVPVGPGFGGQGGDAGAGGIGGEIGGAGGESGSGGRSDVGGNAGSGGTDLDL